MASNNRNWRTPRSGRERESDESRYGRYDRNSNRNYEQDRDFGEGSYGSERGSGRYNQNQQHQGRPGYLESSYDRDYGGSQGFGQQMEDRRGYDRDYDEPGYGQGRYSGGYGNAGYDRGYDPAGYGEMGGSYDYGTRGRGNEYHGRNYSQGSYGNQGYGNQGSYGSQDYGSRGSYTGGGYNSGDSEGYRGSRGYGSYQGQEQGMWNRRGEDTSWTGSDSNRNQQQTGRQQNNDVFRGRGPKGYRRSDERITEDINDRLSDDGRVDASNIEVQVSNGEVVLTGTVDDRMAKRRAEDIAEAVSGVSNVENRIRVKHEEQQEEQRTAGTMSRSADTGSTSVGERTKSKAA